MTSSLQGCCTRVFFFHIPRPPQEERISLAKTVKQAVSAQRRVAELDRELTASQEVLLSYRIVGSSPCGTV